LSPFATSPLPTPALPPLLKEGRGGFKSPSVPLLQKGEVQKWEWKGDSGGEVKSCQIK